MSRSRLPTEKKTLELATHANVSRAEEGALKQRGIAKKPTDWPAASGARSDPIGEAQCTHRAVTVTQEYARRPIEWTQPQAALRTRFLDQARR